MTAKLVKNMEGFLYELLNCSSFKNVQMGLFIFSQCIMRLWSL